MKDSQRAMGWPSGRNRYLHLYLDGLYWGIYDAAERPDAHFAASYLGGSHEDYDVINEFQAKDGTLDAFDALQSIHGLGRAAQYDRVCQRLDITEYIDYLLLNYYAGNQDWGENKNWYALRRRQPAGPFSYFVWDGEQIMHHVHDDVVNRPFEAPFRLAEELRENAEFRLAFADRAQKHLFGDGALTPAAAAVRWMNRASQIDKAIIAESARWGAYRRDPPYTRDRDWLAEQRRLMKTYFPVRSAIVLDQLRSAGLYPAVSAPVIDWASTLSIASPDGGTIYFTTNRADPRLPSGAVAPSASTYAGALPAPAVTSIHARVLKNGVWSALASASPAASATPAAK
jgi:hypothetical protein